MMEREDAKCLWREMGQSFVFLLHGPLTSLQLFWHMSEGTVGPIVKCGRFHVGPWMLSITVDTHFPHDFVPFVLEMRWGLKKQSRETTIVR